MPSQSHYEQLLAKNAPAQGLFCVLTGKIKVSNCWLNTLSCILTSLGNCASASAHYFHF